MALRRLTLLALALLTLATASEVVAYVGGVLSRDLAMTLLGAGVALTCIPMIAALQKERRLEERRR